MCWVLGNKNVEKQARMVVRTEVVKKNNYRIEEHS